MELTADHFKQDLVETVKFIAHSMGSKPADVAALKDAFVINYKWQEAFMPSLSSFELHIHLNPDESVRHLLPLAKKCITLLAQAAQMRIEKENIEWCERRDACIPPPSVVGRTTPKRQPLRSRKEISYRELSPRCPHNRR